MKPLLLFLVHTLAITEDEYQYERRDYSHVPNYHEGKEYHMLTDETFEHETQATTGSTTGDWLILFCEVRHVKLCRELLPTWHSLYGELYGRINVAYIDV
jgi:hypothetical protein